MKKKLGCFSRHKEGLLNIYSFCLPSTPDHPENICLWQKQTWHSHLWPHL